MADTIPSLWPEDIKPTVATPLAILRTQANALSQVTRGILQGRVTSVKAEARIEHQLSVLAPALDYEHQIASVAHGKDLPYPATVCADCYDRIPPATGYRDVSTDDEFKERLREVLTSAEVKSVVSSLIARSNELTERSDATAQ